MFSWCPYTIMDIIEKSFANFFQCYQNYSNWSRNPCVRRVLSCGLTDHYNLEDQQETTIWSNL